MRVYYFGAEVIARVIYFDAVINFFAEEWSI